MKQLQQGQIKPQQKKGKKKEKGTFSKVLYEASIILIPKPEKVNRRKLGSSLAVQWLGLHTLTGQGAGLIPGWGTKIPQATWHG